MSENKENGNFQTPTKRNRTLYFDKRSLNTHASKFLNRHGMESGDYLLITMVISGVQCYETKHTLTISEEIDENGEKNRKIENCIKTDAFAAQKTLTPRKSKNRENLHIVNTPPSKSKNINILNTPPKVLWRTFFSSPASVKKFDKNILKA